MKYIFFFLLVILAACNNNVSNSNTKVISADSISGAPNNRTGFSGVDSVEVYFFSDPGKQKEFTRLFVTDTPSINVLVENLDKQPASMKECAHDGKIFFYRNGDVFKTVYISTADSCRYFAYAMNANSHYVPISDAAFRLIGKLKSAAR
jgi:hypothetical protein